ncbi:MAG: hypothetical protein WCW47_00485 [Candidatus Paceibacterota bacterium]|jgi:hypothetical protein
MNKNFFLLSVSFLFITIFISTSLYASTTISTDINTDGNISIGTTTPWAMFSVNPNGIGNGPEFAIGSSSATHLVVTNSGNVGIGVTSPLSKLSVGGAGLAGAAIYGGGNTYGVDGVGTAYGGLFTGTAGIGVYGSGTTYGVYGNGAGSGVGGYFSSFSGYALITNSGNVGVGTTTPQTKLHVSSGASATTTVTVGELGLTTSKACVNMNASDGSAVSFYFNAAHAMVIESNYCR